MAYLSKGSTSTYANAYEASGAQPEAASPVKKEKFALKIFSPYETYYQGEAVSLSAGNETGSFDILAGHVNFFTLISGGKVRVETGFQRLEFPVSRGILRVHGDTVTLFANV